MIRYVILSSIAFLVTFGAVWWIAARGNGSDAREKADSGEVSRLLRREAEIVEHFCLSRIPPLVGKPAVPSEWEEALGSDIRLREGVGEVAGEAPELAARADDIRGLGVGESIALTAREGDQDVHWLIYRPKAAPNQLLVLSKPGATAMHQLQVESRPRRMLLALIAGLVAAIIQGVSARFLFPFARRV
jgi:hypothetical protein